MALKGQLLLVSPVALLCRLKIEACNCVKIGAGEEEIFGGHPRAVDHTVSRLA
jgi:hypothetical protein